MTLEIALFGSGNECSSIKFVLNNLISNAVKVTDVVATSNCDLNSERETFNSVRFHIIENESINLKERATFEERIRNFWSETPLPNVVLLLGWNFILTEDFLNFFRKNNCLVVNLHPALPDSYVGANAVQQTFDDLTAGKLTQAGSMMHVATPTVDRGTVLGMTQVELNSNAIQTVEQLRSLLKLHEKPLISNVVTRLANEFNTTGLGCYLSPISEISGLSNSRYSPFYRGKVRDVTDIGNDLLLLTASNRVSAFNKHLCEVPEKGSLLNDMSAWWFNNTQHIIPNHFLFSNGCHI